MSKSTSFFAALLIIAQPVLAANPATKADRDRQVSEIVFQIGFTAPVPPGEYAAVGPPIELPSFGLT